MVFSEPGDRFRQPCDGNQWPIDKLCGTVGDGHTFANFCRRNFFPRKDGIDIFRRNDIGLFGRGAHFPEEFLLAGRLNLQTNKFFLNRPDIGVPFSTIPTETCRFLRFRIDCIFARIASKSAEERKWSTTTTSLPPKALPTGIEEMIKSQLLRQTAFSSLTEITPSIMIPIASFSSRPLISLETLTP